MSVLEKAGNLKPDIGNKGIMVMIHQLNRIPDSMADCYRTQVWISSGLSPLFQFPVPLAFVKLVNGDSL